jgi:hypothetical protein
MIRRYITEDPKIKVMTRPIEEIVESFIRLRKQNGWENPEEGLLDPMSEPIMRSQIGVEHARSINKGEFLFIEYDDLVNDTKSVIQEIYDFCKFEPYSHNFDNIVNKYPENDNVYGLLGMHDIRPKISKRLT